jgi:hypothetical protein
MRLGPLARSVEHTGGENIAGTKLLPADRARAAPGRGRKALRAAGYLHDPSVPGGKPYDRSDPLAGPEECAAERARPSPTAVRRPLSMHDRPGISFPSRSRDHGLMLPVPHRQDKDQDDDRGGRGQDGCREDTAHAQPDPTSPGACCHRRRYLPTPSRGSGPGFAVGDTRTESRADARLLP